MYAALVRGTTINLNRTRDSEPAELSRVYLIRPDGTERELTAVDLEQFSRNRVARVELFDDERAADESARIMAARLSSTTFSPRERAVVEIPDGATTAINVDELDWTNALAYPLSER